MIFLSDTRQNCLGKFRKLEELQQYIDSLLDCEHKIEDNKVLAFRNGKWQETYRLVIIKDVENYL